MNHLNVNLIIGAVVLLIVGAAGGYRIAQRGIESADTGAAAQGERKVLYWHDPMVPNARFDKPGKSPFMDMQLVPVYADEQGGAAVSVSSVVTQNLGMRLGIVEKAVLQPTLAAVGSVAFDERLLEVVQARVEGYVSRLHVKAPLERVRRGQQLADIVAPAWLEAQEEYVALLDAQSGRGQAIRDAARQRLTVLGVPEGTIRELDAQRKTNASATLIAPIEGVVTELAIREGGAFMPGAALFRINGLKTVWVNAQIPEAQVSLISMGASVTAHATAWPGAIFKGRVAALLPEVDPQTRTLPVRIVVENPEFKLAPGMFVSLDFEGKADREQLVVPSEAVIMTGERNVVVVARAGGGFDVAEVTVGTQAEGKTAILSGLEEGQAIVLSGQFLIDSEASLKSTVSRLSTAAEPPPGQADRASEDQRLLHLAEGTITAISPEAITIAHGPVPSLKWGAMTMSFKPPARMPSTPLNVGAHVSFSFAPTGQGDEFQVDSITLLDESESKP
jgi:membrane fusion protein, copper/silver efflux system